MWGKIIGGVAGFAMGGPFGAVVGAAIGHAADSGGLGQITSGQFMPRMAWQGGFGFGPARMTALLGKREQIFAIDVVILAAKLSRCDGPVVRAEIDAFKRCFRIPPESVRDVGRLFDQARDSNESFQDYTTQLGAAFSDNKGVLEDVLAALFVIARADGPLNRPEENFLETVYRDFALAGDSWERAREARARRQYGDAEQEDPYEVLGIASNASDETVRAAWRQLMRENHPDTLVARGVPEEFIARAGEKVARINAAWDRIKRQRGL